MTIGERIKLIRENAELSMESFGSKLGNIASSSVNRWEKDQVKITDRSINLICEKFKVNKDWLKDGVGEIYKQLEPREILDGEIDKLLNEQGEYTAFKEAFITQMLKLPDSHWAVIKDLVSSMVDLELAKIEKSDD